MPVVTTSAFLVVAFLCVCGAQAAVLVRSVEQLSANATVRNIQPAYRAAAGANVVFEQCAKEYQLRPEQQTFRTQLFDTVSREYVQAYHDAYVGIVNYPPPQTMVDSYTKIIAAEQQLAVHDTADIIAKRGCGDASLRGLVAYVEKLRNASGQQ